MYVHHNYALYEHLPFIFGVVAFITEGKLFFARLLGQNKFVRDLTGSLRAHHLNMNP